jgi:tRNA C32,U32 (ribose-2'-O)-methylase TrmJ
MMERFSDFFARARPTDLDVRMWRGMLHRVEVTIQMLNGEY